VWYTGPLIRLANGTNKREGRVEIFKNDSWSTVCYRRWDYREAHVVCNHLGYPDGSTKYYEFFGQHNLTVIQNIYCYGDESNIFECNFGTFEVEHCNHRYDAGVICTNNGNYLYCG